MQSRSSLLCSLYGPSLFIDIAQRISILSWQGIAQSLPRYLYALQVYRFTDHLYAADEQSQHLFPSQSRPMLLRELSTEVKTNSYYKGRSAVYSLVTIVIFYASLRWSMMFSIFCPPRICVSIHPLPTDPFYCIGKFYEGINRRYTYLCGRRALG